MGRNVWNRLSVAIGVGGLAVAALAAAPTLAQARRTTAGPAITGPTIISVRHSATQVLAHPPSTSQVLKITLPAGRWALSGKLWGDSVPSTTGANTLVRCALLHGATFLDVGVFNIPRIGNVTSAGSLAMGAVVTLKAKGTVVWDCDDLNTNAQVHDVELTAIGP
jgi:hypothetical protein